VIVLEIDLGGDTSDDFAVTASEEQADVCVLEERIVLGRE
jgi:hypothetical protein